jgi:hypothetical protein
MEKSLRLPIKGGARARVKGFTTFEMSTGFHGFIVPLSFVTCALLFTILVFGDSIRFSDPPTLAPTVVSAEKQLTNHHRRSPRRMFPLRPTNKSTTMMKTTESLSLQNLDTPQIKNEGKKWRLSRRQELRRQHML